MGTRPEIIRLSRIMDKLDRQCQHTIVHTGQNYDYELNQVFFDELQVRKPDYFLNCATSASSAASAIANIIERTDKVIFENQPDAILILGDTNSSLASIAAKKRKIPIFHMEAGNRSFDMRVPEEINRRIVDHISDINLPYTQIARDYLLREGLPPDQIIKTGSPMFEVLKYYEHKIEKSDIMNLMGLKKKKFYVASIHREENVDDIEKLNKIITILRKIAETKKIPVILSTHPRLKKMLTSAEIKLSKNITALNALGFFDYIMLQKNSRAVLSDSGTITEESSILQFPAINLREAHERPEGMEEASVMMAGLNISRVFQALDILEDENYICPQVINDYVAENVSDKILKIIISYTDYVNRIVWRKY